MGVIPLTEQALADCPWAGNDTHRSYVREALQRAERGEVDFLSVADQTGDLVSMGASDYTRDPSCPTLWMLATDPQRRSQGYGSALIQALEEAAAARGYHQVQLSVEDTNPRAYALYQRLGYTDTGQIEHESWQSEDDQGQVSTYHATCHVLRKNLADH